MNIAEDAVTDNKENDNAEEQTLDSNASTSIMSSLGVYPQSEYNAN